MIMSPLFGPAPKGLLFTRRRTSAQFTRKCTLPVRNAILIIGWIAQSAHITPDFAGLESELSSAYGVGRMKPSLWPRISIIYCAAVGRPKLLSVYRGCARPRADS